MDELPHREVIDLEAMLGESGLGHDGNAAWIKWIVKEIISFS